MTVHNQTPVVGKRYLLTGKLGAGGMGAVYRATDRLTGQTVALKRVTVPTEQLLFASRPSDSNADLYLALAHEFQTLSSLRHPYIISVLDYGFDAQHGSKRQPYFTMDYVAEAKSIADVGKTLSVPERLNLVVQLLQALVYLHRRSVLHRDLKPANILVDNSQIRLVDFGLAASSTLSGKFASETAAGTFAYMAPELFQEGIASRASDLYAVGIILYELLAGRHPFDARNPAMLIQSILNTRPDVYSVTENETLSAVLDRLLRKDSAERYQDSAEVIRELCRAAEIAPPTETTEIRESVLQKAQFVGRDVELNRLTESLKTLSAKSGALWLVGGESGVGKSRLLSKFRIRALTEGVCVLSGQAVSEGSSPYQLWREALRWLALLSNLTELEAGVLKTLVPDIEILLDKSVPNAPSLPPPQARERLFVTIETILRRQNQPLALLLEDLQWADEESLALLKHLSALPQGGPVLFLATYRDDEAPDLPKSLAAMRLLKLSRLDALAIAELSQAMLGEAGKEPQVVSLLARETEGNLFFLVEAVRALAEEAGQIEKVGATTLPAKILTGGIRRFVQRRLNRVSPEQYALLQAAAVAGREIDPAVLRARQPGEDVDRFLADCANAAIVDVSDNRWRFSHDKLREEILTTLSAEERRDLHGQIAQTMEQCYADDSQHINALANHFYEGRQWNKAVDYLTRAGDAAARLNAYPEARLHYARTLEALNALPDSLEVRHQRANVLLKQVVVSLLAEKPQDNMAKLLEAEALLQPLIESAESQADDNAQLARVRRWIGRIQFLLNNLIEAREYYQREYVTAQEIGDHGFAGIAASMLGRVLYHQGHFGKAATYLSQALTLLESAGNWVDWVISVAYLGPTLGYMGQYDAGVEQTQRALRKAIEIDSADARALSLGMSSIMSSMTHVADDVPSLALEHAQQAIAVTQQSGDLVYVFWAYGWRAMAETWSNQNQEALASFERLHTLAQTLGGRLLTGDFFAAVEAELMMNLGHIEEALAHSQEAIAYAQSIGSLWSEGLAQRSWGQTLAALDPPHYDEAEAHFAASLQLFETGESRIEAARTHIAWGKVCHERGDLAVAREHFEKAAEQYRVSELTSELEKVQALLQVLE